MKIKILLAALIMGAAFVACKKDDIGATKKSAEFSSKFMEMQKRSAIFRNVMGRKFNTQVNAGSNLKSGDVSNDKDSTTCTSFYDYETCATVKKSTDKDGNEVIVADYGTEGCNDYGVLTKGKIITTVYKKDVKTGVEKWKEEYVDFSYTYSSYVCGYGDTEECKDESTQEETVTMNGTVLVSYSYNEETEEGTYAFAENLTTAYSDGETYVSKATYNEEMTADSYTVTSGEGVYTGKDYKYTYKIVTPVVTNFGCGNNVFIPVSGIETSTYKGKDADGKDESYDYKIDYGNGACDNKATVTENGETKEVSFDDVYFGGTPECETKD